MKYLILGPDELTGEILYPYSEEFFDWFYKHLVAIGDYYNSSFCTEEVANINLELTKKDNKSNGCRIWYKDGTYTKYDDHNYLMDLTDSPELLKTVLDDYMEYTLKSLYDTYLELKKK